MMHIRLPRDYEVDIDETDVFKVPEGFKEEITRVFGEYTDGTSEAYTYQDKLCFIDVCVKWLNGTRDQYESDIVMDKVKSVFAYELENNGEFITESDVYNLEFMAECYRDGANSARLHQEYDEDRHKTETKERLLIEIIKVVMDWEREVED